MTATSLISFRYHSSRYLCFLIYFSCTVWTKMRYLADSLADGMLAGDILIPLPHRYRPLI